MRKISDENHLFKKCIFLIRQPERQLWNNLLKNSLPLVLFVDIHLGQIIKDRFPPLGSV